jgi:tRNA A-37 threonylcarbamoyl transferase component Bud32/tetratricopeptide (TPR) repeat protein
MSEESLFAAALEKETEAERQAFLAAACGGDTALRERVERLLAADQFTRGILEQGLDLIAPPPPEPLAAGRTFAGRYRLRQKIGEGGMGEVWVADQTEPVRRAVALKVVRPGFDHDLLLARFEAERQALALMDHPNIARVFDAGTTPEGRPYFVMELIEGVPITEYCDANHLPPRERLELFVPVCYAVQHAHQKGVIHRDLKPSNILVTLYDAKPVPKVIDFGVAKATGPRLTDESLLTEVGALIGTLEYMSPEQAELNNLDVDTRSDVYALGAILYELLTGTVPFPRADLNALPLSEMLRVIREVDPPRPSARRGEVRAADELDWVVMKCLEKDRARRYETADGLAQDVRRYLADEVVAARPPSAAYRVRKFVRRNRGPVAAAVAVAVVLVAGVGAVAAVQSAAERDRAAAATDRAVREAAATASVEAAVREARGRAEEAWELYDDPARMERATAEAAAAVQRADGVAATAPVTEAALGELASAHRTVDDLTRATRLTAARADVLRKASEPLENTPLAVYNRMTLLSGSYHKALQQYGLDPLIGPVDDVAKAIADSRMREPILGVLLTWSHYMTIPVRLRKKDDLAVELRLREVIRATRLRCGGALARWQVLSDQKGIPGRVEFSTSPEGRGLRAPLAVALALDLSIRGQPEAHRAYLQSVVERYPLDPWLRSDLSAACSGANPPNYGEALHHAAAACALQPDNHGFLAKLGACYAALGNRPQAVAAFDKAIRLRPDEPGTRHAMAAALSKMTDAPSLFSWLAGTWERRAATEGALHREATRVVMEYQPTKALPQEAVVTFHGTDQVIRTHAAGVASERRESFPTLTLTVSRIVTGSASGLKAKTVVYRLDENTLCEVGGLPRGSTDPSLPDVAIWKRVRK